MRCACGCGSEIVPHNNCFGKTVRFVLGHHTRMPSFRSMAAVNGKKNIGAWRSSKAGSKKLIQLGKALGRRYAGASGYMRTDSERIFANMLKEWKIEFRWNSVIVPKGKPYNRGFYRLDFFLPKYLVNVEIDGRNHKKHREKDTLRDSILLS